MGQRTQMADLDDCVLKALQLAARGDIDSAIARLDRFLCSQLGEIPVELKNAVYLHQGLLLEESGAYASALLKFQRIRPTDVFSSLSAVLHQARLLARLGRGTEAELLLREADYAGTAMKTVPVSRQFLLKGLLKDLPPALRPMAQAMLDQDPATDTLAPAPVTLPVPAAIQAIEQRTQAAS
jgi:tetratricopeptide (TPR) repeat protein